MTHQAPKASREIAEKYIKKTRPGNSTRAAIGLIVLKLTGCATNVIDNPFNVQVIADGASNFSDAADVGDDTTPPPMDGATADTPDNPQMDAATEGIASMDAAVDITTTDNPDVSSEAITIDIPSDTTPHDSPADTANELAIVDARVEDAPGDNGLDVSSGEPDAPTEDRQDAQDDRGDNGADIEIIDARDPMDAIDVIDGADSRDVIDATRDLPAEVEGDTGLEAGADARADASPDAGITTRITIASGAPTCTRVIVVGIPGCNPGATECTYSRASRGQVQYIAEAVTVPPSSTVNYSFYYMLSGVSPRQVFTAPNTPIVTPTVANGIYDVTMTPTIGAIAYTSCRGPFIRVVD
jgi:hypothetical protein